MTQRGCRLSFQEELFGVGAKAGMSLGILSFTLALMPRESKKEGLPTRKIEHQLKQERREKEESLKK